MYKQNETPKFYIITGYIDFRCGIDSLCYKLKQIDENINPISNSAFVFVNKQRDRLKFYIGVVMDSGLFNIDSKKANING